LLAIEETEATESLGEVKVNNCLKKHLQRKKGVLRAQEEVYGIVLKFKKNI